MKMTQFVSLLGFAFVAFWIGEVFGDAVLCLVGAALFYAIAAVARGEIDVGDVQSRLRAAEQDLTRARVR